jgi:hypothetical protein
LLRRISELEHEKRTTGPKGCKARDYIVSSAWQKHANETVSLDGIMPEAIGQVVY